MRPLSTRTAGFTDSIIRRMTRISNHYGAINLSQGFPDFDPPVRLPIVWQRLQLLALINTPLHGERRTSVRHLPRSRAVGRD